MNLSSILVMVLPKHLQSTIDALNLIKGVEVHVCEESSGRIIATLEAETITEEVDGLRHIKSLPNIVFAEMVFHYFEDESSKSDNHITLEPVKTQGACCPETACN